MTQTETGITAELVRSLLRDQHPDLADRPVRLGARGWDNQLWRLGGDLAVRLPWATRSADALLRKEPTKIKVEGINLTNQAIEQFTDLKADRTEVYTTSGRTFTFGVTAEF